MLVVDASVAIRWYVAGDYEDQAAGLASDGVVLLAPGLFVSEVANTVFNYVQLGELSAELARTIWRNCVASLDRIVDVADLHEAAFDLCMQVQHPIHDCYYLALAHRESAVFVTADKRFLRKIAGTVHERNALHLADWRP
jgi:predicted nucleic acid-binding protein